MLLSIIIPVYNGEEYIARCLESVFHQSKGLNFELIIIDDASTDQTMEIVEEYANRYPGVVRIFHNEIQKGVSTARNKGMEMACGIWIAFLDADDLLDKHFFENVDTSELYDVIVFDKYKFRNEKKIHILEENEAVTCYSSSDRFILLQAILKIGMLQTKNEDWEAVWGKLYKREFIEKYQIRFCEEVKFGEDVLFNIMVFGMQKNVKHVPKRLYCYRLHSTSTTQKYTECYIEEDKKFYKRLKEALAVLNIERKCEDLLYERALGGIIACLRREVFAKGAPLSRKERYCLLDEILDQELLLYCGKWEYTICKKKKKINVLAVEKKVVQHNICFDFM